MGRAAAILALLVMVILPACGDDTTESAVSRIKRAGYSTICPKDPVAFCKFYHGDGSTPTGGCKGEDCLERSGGDRTMVAASEEPGEFPYLWLLWHQGGELQQSSCGFGDSFTIPANDGTWTKTQVNVPNPPRYCIANVTIGGAVHHEHISTNYVNGCFGWIECTDPAP